MRILKIRQLMVLTALLFLFFATGTAQYKSFKLTPVGDTINRIDKNDKKQGKWMIHVDELRGEPGYEEEGIFKDNNKEGVWRQYNLTSDLIGVENYKLGGKDGIQQYFTFLGELYREESWRAYNPDAPYDTIAVYGTGSNEIASYKIVKAEPYSVKHGEWKYYNPSTGFIVKTEKYERGFLEKKAASISTEGVNTKESNKKGVEKTPEMLEWEKKYSGKKKKYRDGKTKGALLK
jgi:hypothetical protein